MRPCLSAPRTRYLLIDMCFGRLVQAQVRSRCAVSRAPFHSAGPDRCGIGKPMFSLVRPVPQARPEDLARTSAPPSPPTCDDAK